MPISQATAVGSRLPSESTHQIDRCSGQSVTRLTSAQSHSNHCYFNVDGSWDDGRQILISRDIDGGTDLFALDLRDGGLLRLTDSRSDGAVVGATAASVCASRAEAYFWTADALCAVDLRNCRRRRVADLPPGRKGSNTAVTCDGQAVVTILYDDIGGDGSGSTVEKVAFCRARRRSSLVAIGIDDGRITVLHEDEEHLLGHANPSPTDPDLLTFCHEGPWLEIDQRIWGIRRSGGAPWPVVPRVPEWGVGHEFWLSDGHTIGYHARYHEGSWRHALGWAGVDHDAGFQAEVAVPTHHAHARSRERFICDGTREAGDYLLLVEAGPDGWQPPRVLCAHDSSRWQHRSHAHPHLCSDGRTVLFSSDRNGYCDVYLVRIPDDSEELPLYDGPPYRFYWE